MVLFHSWYFFFVKHIFICTFFPSYFLIPSSFILNIYNIYTTYHQRFQHFIWDIAEYPPFSISMVPANIILHWHFQTICLESKHQFLHTLCTPVMFIHTCYLLFRVSWKISWLIPVRDALPDLWTGHHPGYIAVREDVMGEVNASGHRRTSPSWLICPA